MILLLKNLARHPLSENQNKGLELRLYTSKTQLQSKLIQLDEYKKGCFCLKETVCNPISDSDGQRLKSYYQIIFTVPCMKNLAVAIWVYM